MVRYNSLFKGVSIVKKITEQAIHKSVPANPSQHYSLLNLFCA